ncbi:hypothetical protein J6E39_08075 [bacterium]|nr:hypothetical protein [bacterium]
MYFELPQIVSKKTGTVVNRSLRNIDLSPNLQYIRRELIPGQDTFLSQKGVTRIRKDSDCKTVHVYNKNGQIVLSDIPQKIRPYFEQMRQFSNVNLDSFLK